jgi:DNA-binding LacI/PurR family transcriptional regulator
MAKATIEEVAKRAGVTKSTVSHALSGKRPVAPETRRRIEAAIAELGYRPNAVAQRLAAGRSGAIGLVFPATQESVSTFDMPFVAAATAASSRAGYALQIILAGDGGAERQAERLNDGLLDGALLLRAAPRDLRVAALRESDLPFVLIGRTADNAGLSFVDVDVDAAVDRCVELLAAAGHRRIAFLRDGRSGDAGAGRALGAYELACARRRLRLLTAPCDATVSGARAATRDVLREHPDVTGLVAWSEWAAWGAVQAAADAGRRVPADLSLVGMGHGVAAELLPFEPTVVDLRSGPLAEAAVELLLRQLDADGSHDEQTLLEPELMEGRTLAPPRDRE